MMSKHPSPPGNRGALPRIPRSLIRVPTLLLTAAVLFAAARPVPAQGPDGAKIPAPEFPMGLKWLNTTALTMQALRGKVVLIDFWEYTCVNCIRTFPYMKAWHDKYKDKGLVIIGVHTPEFAFAKSLANVDKAVKDFGFKYPIIVDSEMLVWNAYGNRFWPAKYLIDKDGNARYFHAGEGAYEATEARIQQLLKEANPKLELPGVMPVIRGTDKPGAVCYPVTPELYMGSLRGGHAGTLANREGYQSGGRPVTYRDPGGWQDGLVYVSGQWKSNEDALITTRESPSPRDYIAIRYHALEVNSVMRPEDGKPIRLWVYHDGKPVAKKDRGDDVEYDDQGRSFITVDEPRMYYIIKNEKFGHHTLRLATAQPGFGIYSFTFVSCEVRKQ